MVEIPNGMDQMVLYDVNHAKENEMCTPNDFDLLNPNEIQIDAMNIPIMSIKIRQTQFEPQ